MKKIITLSGFAGVFLSLLFLGGTNVSCNKPTECLATITVLDTNNKAVDSAKIVVSSPNGGAVATTVYTNSSGVAPVNFNLPAVLNVNVAKVYTAPYWYSLTGTGVLELQAGQTVYLTINLH